MEITQQAYILHARPYRETSLLATLLTAEQGKINAVIRGARGKGRAAMHKSALLQPFQKLLLQWRGKQHASSDLVTVRALEAEPLRFPLEGEASFCGLYINELLYRLLYPGVSVETLFGRYETALYELLKTQNRNQQAWVLRRFELQILTALGVEIQCREDAHQQPVQPQRLYHYYAEMGAYPLSDAGSEEIWLQESQQPVGQGVAIQGECLLKLADEAYCEICLPQWKALLRQILKTYLGPKPILARQLFR
ncbi:DNA repair protein RecO [Thiomicrorhabdus sp. zzn3]|uniref:DNA repair protein RecO n=1 Tax=Thiomicrorhabdus sp. zzn3 TaxID=3039775 RepID=UPI0024372B0D|nr:DNA repair protein RecO [Thiomicrorhabdus sp. zzn3]MDG6777801.1 DNA repair protein RecO [Thiomicrorhabdus sp. zzn3]